MQNILLAYAKNGIKVSIVPKPVKNINFRIQLIDDAPFTSLLNVSYPLHVPTHLLLHSLQNRLDWAVNCQNKQLQQRLIQQKKPLTKPNYIYDIAQLSGLDLASSVYYEGKSYTMAELLLKTGHRANDVDNIDFAKTLVDIYRHWLICFIKQRQPYWQSKVEKSARKITPYMMKTRWGSCSTRTTMIRLSIWLAQFEPSCADYVMVHELCHLHEANHSAKFWQQVERVMPDYKTWHDKLKFANHHDLSQNI